MKVHVRVHFEGVVEIEMTVHLSSADQMILAQKLALAQILATSNNPDCGEAMESACEEFVEETGGTEGDFDRAKVIGITGVWSLAE